MSDARRDARNEWAEESVVVCVCGFVIVDEAEKGVHDEEEGHTSDTTIRLMRFARVSNIPLPTRKQFSRVRAGLQGLMEFCLTFRLWLSSFLRARLTGSNGIKYESKCDSLIFSSCMSLWLIALCISSYHICSTILRRYPVKLAWRNDEPQPPNRLVYRFFLQTVIERNQHFSRKHSGDYIKYRDIGEQCTIAVINCKYLYGMPVRCMHSLWWFHVYLERVALAILQPTRAALSFVLLTPQTLVSPKSNNNELRK